MAVVEVQSRNRKIRFRLLRLLLERNDSSFLIELDDSVPFRVAHRISEDLRAGLKSRCLFQYAAERCAVEQVVAKNQARRLIPDEFLPDDEGLRDSVRPRLLGVAERHAD